MSYSGFGAQDKLWVLCGIRGSMIKKNRALVPLQSLLLIVIFVALGMFWKDSLFPCLLNLFAWGFIDFSWACRTENRSSSVFLYSKHLYVICTYLVPMQRLDRSQANPRIMHIYSLRAS